MAVSSQLCSFLLDFNGNGESTGVGAGAELVPKARWVAPSEHGKWTHIAEIALIVRLSFFYFTPSAGISGLSVVTPTPEKP